MITRARQWLLAGCGLILVALAYRNDFGTPKVEPDTAEYHYKRLLYLRRNLMPSKALTGKNLFSVRNLNWYLDGKPSFSDQHQEMQKHQDALVRLGFFEIRSFPFDGTDQKKALSNLARTVDMNRVWELRIVNGQEDSVWVTARKEDMGNVARSIRVLNAETNR